jgi:hypothetical protein
MWRRVPFLILIAALLLFGVVPGLLTEKIEPSARNIIGMVKAEAAKPVKATAAVSPK